MTETVVEKLLTKQCGYFFSIKATVGTYAQCDEHWIFDIFHSYLYGGDSVIYSAYFTQLGSLSEDLHSHVLSPAHDYLGSATGRLEFGELLSYISP